MPVCILREQSILLALQRRLNIQVVRAAPTTITSEDPPSEPVVRYPCKECSYQTSRKGPLQQTGKVAPHQAPITQSGQGEAEGL